MKIKKIAALCSREGVFHLASKTDREGVVTQWLGDGGAFYPLLGAPVLDEAGLCTMFDITGKKRDSTIVRKNIWNPWMMNENCWNCTAGQPTGKLML